jgi:hypothetical protein
MIARNDGAARETVGVKKIRKLHQYVVGPRVAAPGGMEPDVDRFSRIDPGAK